MRKTFGTVALFATALLLTGVLAGNAGATTLTGATAGHRGASASLVEKVGCRVAWLCPIGEIRICSAPGVCECVPCERGLRCTPPKRLVNVDGTWVCR
jgi:hypothetical protein